MVYSYIQRKAQAAYNSAEKTYSQAIETQAFFDQLLDGVPVDDQELYQQVQRWHEEAVQCINAAWNAKHAAEQAMAAVQPKSEPIRVIDEFDIHEVSSTEQGYEIGGEVIASHEEQEEEQTQ